MKKKGKKKEYFTRWKVRNKTADTKAVPTQESALAPADTVLPDAEATTVDRAFVEKMIATVGTGLWRMRQKLVNPDTNEPHEDMRPVYRNFESVWDSIRQAGAEIQDHTGNLYISGTTLRVIAFQPTADIDRELVTETLKPTIYFEGRMIQMGEVIVAIPDMNA
jgi:gentisate 1,2-dioxygenase